MNIFQTVLKKQAVVNAGLNLFLDEESGETFEYCYENGIVDYIKEISGEKAFTEIQFFETHKG